MKSPDTPASRMVRVLQNTCRSAPLRARGRRDEDFERLMQRELIPGASMAVIHDGQVEWTHCAGLANKSGGAPVTPETRFQAASISKPVAALVLLTLVQEGRVDLDASIHNYLRRWQLPANDGWLPRITPRMLLSHSGGVTVEGFLGYAHSARIPTLLEVLNGDAPANSLPIQVDTLPGVHFRYSGGGYTILQQIIEDLTAQPLHQAAHQRVLEPLGMTHSTYLCPLPAELAPYAATGHRSDGEPLAGGWHHYPESAAAGLWTTPLDLAQLLVELERVLAGEPGRILSRPLLEEMLSPQIRVRGIDLDGDEGLGFFLTREDDDIYYGHGGSNEGYRSSLIARKGRGQAAIIMTNSDNGSELTEAWMNAVALEYGWTGYASPPPPPFVMPPDRLALYAGRYRLPDGLELSVQPGQDGLLLLVSQQPPLVMKPTAPDRFSLSQINGSIRFVMTAGQCSALQLRQNGEDVPATRIQ